MSHNRNNTGIALCGKVVSLEGIMALGGKHSVPGFDQSLEALRELIQESPLEEDYGLKSVFELVDKSLSEALNAFSDFDNNRAEKLRCQMEPLAQSARDLLEKFSEAVGTNPERSGIYVNLIIMVRSLEQIVYLIESVTEDIMYVTEAEDVRHGNNRLAVEE
jgi:phosphate uptake regulator